MLLMYQINVDFLKANINMHKHTHGKRNEYILIKKRKRKETQNTHKK